MGLLRWLAGWAGRLWDGTPLVFVLLLFTVLTFILVGERVVVVKGISNNGEFPKLVVDGD